MSFDLTSYLLNEHERYHAKIGVYPWSGVSVTNSIIPEPTRFTKRKILSILLDIYENWKNQLDKFGQPYYLKLWPYEPRFSKSQVVCAIGASVAYYENNFFIPEKDRAINPDNYGQLKHRLEKLNWDYRFDEDHFSNYEVYDPELYASKQDFDETRIWFNKLLKKPHRTEIFNNPNGDRTESYSFKCGDMWIGGLK